MSRAAKKRKKRKRRLDLSLVRLWRQSVCSLSRGLLRKNGMHGSARRRLAHLVMAGLEFVSGFGFSIQCEPGVAGADLE